MTDAFNPYAHLKAAASGDVEAMRLLASNGHALALNSGDSAALVEALVFARLAYAATGAREDAGLLVRLLSDAHALAEQEDETGWAVVLQAELIATVSQLTDAGEEYAGLTLPVLVDASSPEATKCAARICQLMKEGA